MALYHRATITPSKPEIVAAFTADQPWGGPDAEAFGAFRFDDPLHRTGLETHLARLADGTVVHVPLTYRDEPLAGAEEALICTTEHSVLGTRWVYDGVRDPLHLTMLTAVAMTGQGEALGMVEFDGRWVIAPAPSRVRLRGGGWHGERVPVDGHELVGDDGASVTLVTDRFELVVHRRLVVGSQPAMGLTATWDGQDDPVVLAEVRER